MKKSKKILQILLLDDAKDLAVYYKRNLEKFKGFKVTIETDSNRARSLAQKQLFDIIVIDAKLDYRGFEFGGLRLADDVRPRYGANSVIIVSHYITTDLAQIQGADHEFLSKHQGENPNSFVRALSHKLKEMCLKQYVFVAMPFSEKFSKIYRHIKVGIANAGFKCVRVDKVSHTKSIQSKTFDLVSKSKIVVFVADEGNPNAYYEAGFADAMDKEVIILAKEFKDLPFDIRDRQAIDYGNKPSAIEEKLAKKILSLCHDRPLAF